MDWDLGVCAIVSDVHGNRNALNAVLDDLSQEHIDRIICLGDIIGYGAKPTECLDLVQERASSGVLGNHDSAALFDPERFNPAAEASALWTRSILEGSRKADDYFTYLGELKYRFEHGDALFVHGSPRTPLTEYVFPDDIYEERKMRGCFEKFEHLSFQGHTHIPGIFVNDPEVKFIESSDLGDAPFKFESDRKYMINVGSVGQPRDGDARACYAIFDGDTVRYKRVEYDIEASVREILAIKDFEQFKNMAFRLRTGS